LLAFSLNNATIDYKEDFLSVNESLQMYESFVSDVQWVHREIMIFGKRIKEPRLTAWYGDEEASYKYSGIELKPLPWYPKLLDLKKRIETFTEQPFNSVLFNWYRDGNDSMGWHSDDEKELGLNPVIASLSLGEARDFQFRRKDDHNVKKQITLKSGSLLVMSGEMQTYWQHQTPKRKRINEGRINLTFRKIL